MSELLWAFAISIPSTAFIVGVVYSIDHLCQRRRRRAYEAYLDDLREDAKIYGGG